MDFGLQILQGFPTTPGPHSSQTPLVITLFWERALCLNSLGSQGGGKKKDSLSFRFLKKHQPKINPHAKETHFGVANFVSLHNQINESQKDLIINSP